MQPRTKLQKQAMALSRELEPITKAFEKWAIKTHSPKYAVVSRNRTFCLECGHKWDEKLKMVELTGNVVCPHCKTKLTYNHNQHVKCDKIYLTVLTTYNGFQVVRIILLTTLFKKKESVKHCFNEVVQHWISPEGKKCSLSVSCNTNYGLYDMWVSSELEPRTNTYTQQLREEINGFLYPRKRILPVIKRNGFKSSFYDMSPQELFPLLLSDNKVETLFKTKQYDLIRYYKHSYNRIQKYWKSIKICIRHNYMIKDACLWLDHLELLEHFNMDFRNPKYICSENIREEHHTLIRKKNKIEERRRQAEQDKRNIEYQAKYKLEKGIYFGLKFIDGELKISPLKSIEEFKNEGESLHHCVYANGYYKDKDSLILSAKVLDRSIETIEISLRDFQIIQSRGAFNKPTEYHDRIINMVKHNMESIAAIKEQKQLTVA